MIGAGILKALEASRYRRQLKAVAGVCFAATRVVLRHIPGGERCPVCSARLCCLWRPVVSDDLVRDWCIDGAWRHFFDVRDGQICVSCGASLRVRDLASAMLVWLATKGEDSATIIAAVNGGILRRMSVAEVNSCGELHGVLACLPNIAYSEYLPSDVTVRREDLMGLSYDDESFDLVLHSDTLEHTPDVDRALAEIQRILRPGGATIFTVPIVRDGRPTRVRAEVRDGATHHILEPSYHGGSYQATRQYLVYYEFGEDFAARVSAAGFDVVLREHASNPAVVTFVAEKPATAIGG